MPGRLMVGQLTLNQFIGVQIPAGQHSIETVTKKEHTQSSSNLGG